MYKWFIWIIIAGIFTFQVESRHNFVPTRLSSHNITELEMLGTLGRGYLSRLAWSPDGQWLAVSTSLGIELYDYNNMTAPPEYANVPDNFIMLTIHPVENWLVGYNSIIGDIIFWDIETEQIITTIDLISAEDDETKRIRNLDFNETGTQLAIVYPIESGVGFNSVEVWDITSHYPQILTTIPSRGSTDIIFRDEYVFILSWQDIFVFNPSRPEMLQRYPTLGLRNATINPQRPIIIRAYMSGITVWNIENILSGEVGRDDAQTTYIELPATDIAYSADGNFIASTLEAVDGITIQDANTFDVLWTFTGFSVTSSATFSQEHFAPHPIDNFLVFRDQNTLYTYQFTEQAPQILSEDYNIASRRRIIENNTGTQIATVDSFNRASVWELPSLNKIFTLPTQRYESIGSNHFVVFNQNDNLITYADDTLSLWDITTQEILHQISFEAPLGRFGMEISPDGRWVAIGNLVFDAITLEWNEAFSQALHQQEIHDGAFIEFILDSEYMLFSQNEMIFVLSVSDGTIIDSAEHNDNLSPRILLFCEQNVAEIPFAQMYISELENLDAWIMSVSLHQYYFTPDCTRRIDSSGRIRVYDTATNEQLSDTEIHGSTSIYGHYTNYNNSMIIIHTNDTSYFIDAETGQVVYGTPVIFRDFDNRNPEYYLFRGAKVWGIRE